MAINLRATPVRSAYTTSTSVDFARPTGLAAGDLIQIIFYGGSTSVVPTPPSGWNLRGTKLPFAGGSSDNYRAWKYWKFADGSEPATISFALSENTDHTGAIMAYSGVDTTNPFDVAGTTATGNSASIDLPSVTTVTYGTLISWMALHWNGAGGSEVASPGFTMQLLESTRDNIVQDRTLPAPGPTGVVSVATASTPWVGWIDALRAAGGPGGGYPGTVWDGTTEVAGYWTGVGPTEDPAYPGEYAV